MKMVFCITTFFEGDKSRKKINTNRLNILIVNCYMYINNQMRLNVYCQVEIYIQVSLMVSRKFEINEKLDLSEHNFYLTRTQTCSKKPRRISSAGLW